MPTPEQIRDASGQHAVTADKIFDGSRWHTHAAVLIKGGRIHGIAAPGDILDDWPQRRLPMGAILAPPVPAFYHRPQSVDEIVDQSVDRVLDLIGLPSPEARRWNGPER